MAEQEWERSRDFLKTEIKFKYSKVSAVQYVRTLVQPSPSLILEHSVTLERSPTTVTAHCPREPRSTFCLWNDLLQALPRGVSLWRECPHFTPSVAGSGSIMETDHVHLSVDARGACSFQL